jgi:hypothetical protein
VPSLLDFNFNCDTADMYLNFWQAIKDGLKPTADGRYYKDLTKEEQDSLDILLEAGRLYKKACEGTISDEVFLINDEIPKPPTSINDKA